MLRLSPFWAPSSVICLMLVVPEVDTMVLPLRSSTVLRFADFLDTKRLAVTKCVMVKETCFCRSRLLVVEPHSRSMVPFAINGMRVAEDRVEPGVDLGELEPVLHPVDDAGAEVHGVAHDLLAVVVIGKRQEETAAERDGAGVLDLLSVPVRSWASAGPARKLAAAIVGSKSLRRMRVLRCELTISSQPFGSAPTGYQSLTLT